MKKLESAARDLYLYGLIPANLGSAARDNHVHVLNYCY